MSIRLDEIPAGCHFKLAEDIADDPYYDTMCKDTLREVFLVVQHSAESEHFTDNELSWTDESDDESFDEALSSIKTVPDNMVLVVGTSCNPGVSLIRGDRLVRPLAISSGAYSELSEEDFRGDWSDQDEEDDFEDPEDDYYTDEDEKLEREDLPNSVLGNGSFER